MSLTELSYRGNNGTQAWSGPWVEHYEYDGPEAGNVNVVPDGNGYALHIKQKMVDVKRTANLSGATQATLSFKYKRAGFAPNNVVCMGVSTDGGLTIAAELVRWTGPFNDTAYQTQTVNLTPYITPNTAIVFWSHDTNVRYLTISMWMMWRSPTTARRWQIPLMG